MFQPTRPSVRWSSVLKLPGQRYGYSIGRRDGQAEAEVLGDGGHGRHGSNGSSTGACAPGGSAAAALPP